MVGNVIVPEIRVDERTTRYLHGLYVQWKIEHDKLVKIPPFENVVFEHNPNWRNNWISIQAAHDKTNFVWQIGYITFTLSQLVPYLVRIIH